jgi:methyl coenzyme M reductase subunit D
VGHTTIKVFKSRKRITQSKGVDTMEMELKVLGGRLVKAVQNRDGVEVGNIIDVFRFNYHMSYKDTVSFFVRNLDNIYDANDYEDLLCDLDID